jgi:hypothetical protein
MMFPPEVRFRVVVTAKVNVPVAAGASASKSTSALTPLASEQLLVRWIVMPVVEADPPLVPAWTQAPPTRSMLAGLEPSGVDGTTVTESYALPDRAGPTVKLTSKSVEADTGIAPGDAATSFTAPEGEPIV